VVLGKPAGHFRIYAIPIGKRKTALIFAHQSRQVEIIIKFCAAKDSSLTGVTFAPTRAEALMVKADLEKRGYVVDLPTRNVPRTTRSQGAIEEGLIRERPCLGSRLPRYRWLRGDGAWLDVAER
jgi:hypothetical protein